MKQDGEATDAKILEEPQREISSFSRFVTEEEAVAYLADILVTAYFEQRKHERIKQPS